MKKIVLVILGCLMVLLIAGCDTGAMLADWVDEEQVTQNAQEIVDLINNRDFDEIADRSMVDGVTADDWAAGLEPSLDVLGEFKGFGPTSMQMTKEGDIDFITVLQSSEYEETSITYVISFTKDASLAGIYIFDE